MKNDPNTFTGKVNHKEMTFEGYLIMPTMVREKLMEGVTQVNGCGSNKRQLLLMKLFQYVIKADLTPACIIHDMAYGKNFAHSRANKVQADADLHLNIFRILIRSGSTGFTANVISRLIHTTLVLFGDKAYNA